MRRMHLRRLSTEGDARPTAFPANAKAALSVPCLTGEGSAIDSADLRALEAQIVHQPLRIEDEGDNRAGELVGIDGPSGTDRDHHDRSIDADLPTIGVLESGER